MPAGRPKKTEGELRCLDVRLTPSGGEVTFNPTTEDFKVFLACREGGEGTNKALHYHIYCETLRSDTWLTKYWYLLTGYGTSVGNKAFKQGKAHDSTIGYVVKEGHVVCRHGCTDQFINEWFDKSKQYRADHEADRKRKHRESQKSLDDILKEVIKEPIDPNLQFEQYTEVLISRILTQYVQCDKRFPSRSQLDNVVSKHMYTIPGHGHHILRLYNKTFTCQFI